MAASKIKPAVSKVTKAAKRRVAKKKIARPSPKKVVAKVKATPKPAPKPKQPTQPTAGYPTSNVATNSSGNIQLQTNAEIEGELLNAVQAAQEADSEATTREQQAEITHAANQEANRVNANKSRGRTNYLEGYQGLHGTSALRKRSENEYGITAQQNATENAYSTDKQSAYDYRTAAQTRLKNAEAIALAKRQDFTNQQSRTSPTEGSVAEDSGVKATKPTPGIKINVPKVPKMGVTTKKVTTKPKPKPKPKPSVKKAAQRKVAKK